MPNFQKTKTREDGSKRRRSKPVVFSCHKNSNCSATKLSKHLVKAVSHHRGSFVGNSGAAFKDREVVFQIPVSLSIW